MNKEINRKSIFMRGLKDKVSYVFNKRDLKEIETIIDFYEKQLEQKNYVIEEILNFGLFENDCPFSLFNDDYIEKLCDCENCQDEYKECWLKYFKNKCKGDNNE